MSETSLNETYKARWYCPAGIIIAMGLLVVAWFLPTLKMTTAIFFHDTYSIWTGITELWGGEHYFLAGLIFFFSMIFPLGKLLLLLGLWFFRMSRRRRMRMLYTLELLGKWSMIDVYVVATLVVLIKAKDVADANAQIGIYLFAAAIIVSLIFSNWIKALADRMDEEEH